MPVIAVFCGPPCSGKTDISRMVQKSTTCAGWARFAMDELRLAHWPFSLSAQTRADAYGLMHQSADGAIRGGAVGVILDATYQPSQQRHALRALADGLSATLIVFECQVSPDDAVERFNKRGADHAATDLSAEKVWDLAQDFSYFDGATLLDTSRHGRPHLRHAVLKRISTRRPTKNLKKWVKQGNPHILPPAEQQSASDKLTSQSRLQAKLRYYGGQTSFWVSVALIFLAALVLLFAIVQSNISFQMPSLLQSFVLPGNVHDWIKVLFSWAAVSAALIPAYVFFFRSPEVQRLRAVKDAGKTPRFDLQDVQPSNREVFRRYYRRLPEDQQSRMLIRDVPLWFLVPPRPEGFEVMVGRVTQKDIDEHCLRQRAATFGLDWNGYFKWREDSKRKEYFGPIHETKVRVLDLVFDNGTVALDVCRGSFMKYLCTELSANVHSQGRYAFEMRQVLEGPAWTRSDPANKCCRLDLDDVREAGKTHEMLLGIQAALTTVDGYLILQRRSNRVQSAAGGVTASGAGSANWRDLFYFRDFYQHNPSHVRSLVPSAVRETREEIGWIPHVRDKFKAPFLGAAFSLMRGRDLNFYCHLHTQMTLQEICENATRAQDSWETAHLIPVPVEALQRDGTLCAPLDALIGKNARHIRGLLYCLAQSRKFEEIQKRFLARSSTTIHEARIR
jgi:predicted kinase